MNDIENLHKEMHGLKANKEIFEQVKSYAYEYMDNMDERPVFPSDEALKGLDVFDESIPENSCSSSEILRLLHEHGSPATVAQSGGMLSYYQNWMITLSLLHRQEMSIPGHLIILKLYVPLPIKRMPGYISMGLLDYGVLPPEAGNFLRKELKTQIRGQLTPIKH